MNDQPILKVVQLKKHFQLKRTSLFSPEGKVYALDDVSFDLMPGETLGVVGESGCGKSTLGRTILRLLDPTDGQIIFDGKDITRCKGSALKQLRPQMQIIFQDPYSSLNPRMTVEHIVGDSLTAHGLAERKEIPSRVSDILEKVGIHRLKMKAFPHEFSGGQRQRIAIARALILNPRMVICDEPVSALDVSIKAQVINLLADLQNQFKFSYIMISHDLGVVKHVSNRILVMYLGQAIELAANSSLIANPLHPYTQALISAIPVMDPENKSKRIVLKGELPSPSNPPAGCRFHARCWKTMDICSVAVPKMVEKEPGHFVMCHLYNPS
jgi:oligopeptide/dipeptide ABC transporter ATP-binding protein